MDRKMTDDEIVKALECCSEESKCEECPYGSACLDERYVSIISKDALGLIKRYKEEILRYRGVIKILEKDVKTAKDEAVKEFSHFIIDKARNGIIYTMDIPDYVRQIKKN